MNKIWCFFQLSLGGAEMVVVAVFAFVDREWARAVIILRDLGGQLGFFASIVNNFMAFAYPATRWVVGLIWV